MTTAALLTVRAVAALSVMVIVAAVSVIVAAATAIRALFRDFEHLALDVLGTGGF